MERDLSWLVVYTKPRAETWTEINLRKQGFATLLPRVRERGRVRPLFPRYVFVGMASSWTSAPLKNTRGVQYVVQCGEHPARVPQDVVADIRSRMDVHGIVVLDNAATPPDPLYARAQRERVRTLLKLASAGYRVVA